MDNNQAYADHLQSMAEIEQVKDAAFDLLEAAKNMTFLVKLKYGNLDKGIYRLILKAEAAIEKATKKPV